MDLTHDISGEGPLGEVLVIIDQPSEDDLKEGKPFISKSSQAFRRFLASVGLDKVRFEYLVNRRGLSFYIDRRETLPTPEHLAWRKDLLSRIKLINPKLIIACGETAMRAVTDYQKLSDAHGYVLDSLFVPCRVIATIHPAELYAQYSNIFWIKYTLAKAKEVLDGAKDKDFSLLISNSESEIRGWMSRSRDAKELSIDIETIKGKAVLTALGAAVGPDEAISVTPDSPAWNEFVTFILGKLQDPSVRKIGQNFIFDSLVLWKLYGTRPAGDIWDTMHAANVLRSDLKKSLAELGRFYLYCAPWKGGWKLTGRELRKYNGLDLIATFRIYERQKAELARLGLSDYFSHTQEMFLLGFDLAARGLKVDLDAKQKMASEVEAALAPVYELVTGWAVDLVPAGQKKKKKRNPSADIPVSGSLDLIPLKERKGFYVAKKKDLKWGHELGRLYKKAFREEIELYRRNFNPKSPAQTLAVLKNAGVQLPHVKKTKDEWGESTNEKALKKILERNNDSAEVLAFVRNMLLIREGEKLMSSYCLAALDEDGRWRCTYNPEGTETGRSATRKTPWETGGNNQNIPREGFRGVKFKKVFVADERKIFFQSDQEQAEARVVAALSGCQKMLELFATGQDVHEYAAASILGLDMKALKEHDPAKYKLYRQYAKIVNHGGNYDMGPATLAENALKDGIDLSVAQATEFLAARKKVFPEIYAWHVSLREELHKNRMLWTPFGRRRVWIGKIGPEMYREIYAHTAQSVVPHITNLMWKWAAKRPEIEVVQMGHDSLLTELPEDRAGELISAFLEETKKIRFSCGVEKDFNIPWDASIGFNWSELHKWQG